MVTEEMMVQALFKMARVVTTDNETIEGIADLYTSSVDEDDGVASIVIMPDRRDWTLLFATDIESITILPLRTLIRKLSSKHINFIKSEFSIPKSALINYSEEQLYEIYDKLCEIECEEIPSDGEKLSKRGALASELVTLLGNEIAKAEGNFDEEEFEKELNDCN